MKKISSLLAFSVLVILASCIKNDPKIYSGESVAEFDAVVWNTPATGATWPILTRHAGFNRPISTADSTVRRIGNNLRLRVNLVGPVSKSDQTVGFKTFGPREQDSLVSFPATISGQTPSAAAATLKLFAAVEGTHFSLPAGNKITIPADSSFGYLNITILNPGPTAGEARFVGIQLDSTGTLKPSPNFARVAVAIDQR